MTVLNDLLSAATDDEDEIIRSVARRAGVLWHCERCTFDNPGNTTFCASCKGVSQEQAEPGDDDPTPSGVGLAEEEICGRQLYGRFCTRRAHGDDLGALHVAGNDKTVVATWFHRKAETGMETVLLMKPADASAVGAPIEFEHTTIRRNRVAVSVLPDTPTDAAH